MKVTVSPTLLALQRDELQALAQKVNAVMRALPKAVPCPLCGQPSRLASAGLECFACMGLCSEKPNENAEVVQAGDQ